MIMTLSFLCRCQEYKEIIEGVICENLWLWENGTYLSWRGEEPWTLQYHEYYKKKVKKNSNMSNAAN